MNFKEYNWLINEGFKEKESLFLKQGNSIRDIKFWFEKFKELKSRNKLPKDKIDIDKYEKLSDLMIMVNQYLNALSKNEIKKQIKIDGAELIKGTKNWLLYLIKTEAAAKLLGKGTRWCISAEQDNAFEGYEPNYNIYFLIHTNENSIDPNSIITPKIALLKDKKDRLLIFDEYDNEMSYLSKSTNLLLNGEPYNLAPLLLPKKINQSLTMDIIVDGTYTLAANGRYDVDGDVLLQDKGLDKIPFMFNTVTGNFYCNENRLTSLEGCPVEVGGRFTCAQNQLTSLEHGPIRVKQSYSCSNNQLTSLKGSPKHIPWNFYCDNNQLISLEGGPERVGHDFDCTYNKLTNLNGLPKHIGYDLWIGKNPLNNSQVPPNSKVGGTIYYD